MSYLGRSPPPLPLRPPSSTFRNLIFTTLRKPRGVFFAFSRRCISPAVHFVGEFSVEISTLEKRLYSFDRLEFRSGDQAGQRPRIVGVASTYGILSQPLPLDDKGNTFVERVMPGAFDEACQTNDIKSFWNHDSRLILGRFSNRTLSLQPSGKALGFEAIPPVGVSYIDDLRALMEQGYVFECSFGFHVWPGGDRWLNEDGKRVRELIKCDLREVSVVSDPAYIQGATTAAVRSFSAWQTAEQRRRQRQALAVFSFRSRQPGHAPRSTR